MTSYDILVYHIVYIACVLYLGALSDFDRLIVLYLIYLSAHDVYMCTLCWSLMSGCRVFLLSRGLLTPLSPLSVAGLPQGAAQGETLERACASGRALGWWRGRRLILCASTLFIFSLETRGVV